MNKKISLILLFLCFAISSELFGQAIGLRHYDVDEGIPQGDIYTISQDAAGFLWIGTGNGFARFDGHEMHTYTERSGLADNFISAIKVDSLRNGIWLGHSQGLLSFYHQGTDSIAGVQLENQNLLSKIQQIIVEERQVWALTEREGLLKITEEEGQKNVAHYPIKNLNLARCNVFEKITANEFLIGTDSGLVVGKIKDNYLFLEHNNNLLSQTPIYSIAKKQGNQTGFWIGTGKQGIYEFLSLQKINQSFVKDKQARLLQNEVITSLLEDKKGRLWIGTQKNGVYRIKATKKQEKVVEFAHYNEKNGLPTNTVSCLLQDYEGSLWIGTSNHGLVQIMNEMFEIYTEEHRLKQSDVKSIVRLSDNKLLLGTNSGLYGFSTTEDSISCTLFEKSLASYTIQTMLRETEDRVWVGTADNGLYWLNPLTGKVEKPKGVPASTIHKIIDDAEGNIWIATNSWGLFQYIKPNKKFIQVLPSKTLPIDRVHNIYRDTENRIWIASPDYTLAYWKADKITVLDAVPEFSQVTATCFAEDSQNRLWIGTEGSGVFSYTDEAIQKYTTSNGLASNYSYFIASDHNYNIWIGSRKGITRFRPNDNLAKVYHHTDGFVGTEANRDAVLKDINGDLWFGTNNGLIRYIGQNDHINLIKPRVILTGFRVFGEEKEMDNNLTLPYNDYSIRFDFRTITFRYPDKVKFKYRLKGFDKEWSEEVSQSFAYYSHLEDGIYTFEVLATNDDGVWASRPTSYSFEIATPIWKQTWFFVLMTLLVVSLIFILVRWRTRSLEKKRHILELEVSKQTEKLRLQNDKLEKTNSRLIDSEQELSEANLIKDRMFSIISHDLRSPLATLQNFLKMFMSYRQAFSEEEITKVTRDINRSLYSVGDLLENLLQWSRAQMGHLEMEVQPLVVIDYIQQNIELLLPTANGKGINLQVRHIKNENLKVSADPNLLNFILRNLISNAIKFTEKDGSVTVGIDDENPEKGMVRILVKDTGVGMNNETASQIFENDKVVSTRGTANEKGTGLGLMVCKEFVEKQGGQIWVESVEKAGTTFIFSLPLITSSLDNKALYEEQTT